MYSDYQSPNITVINDRSSEGLADANIRIGNINASIAELEIKLQAMYRVMLEQGIDPQLFEAKIDEIMKERASKPAIPAPTTKPCQKCGRAVKKSANSPLLGKCMYCGSPVPFTPTFLPEEPEAEGEDGENKTEI